MQYIALLFGAGIGFKICSEVIWQIFFALPMARKLEKEGKMKKSVTVAPFLVMPALSLLLLGAFLYVLPDHFPDEMTMVYSGISIGSLLSILFLFFKNHQLNTHPKNTWEKFLNEEK